MRRTSSTLRLQVCSADADGRIAGRARPHTMIEAINVSRLTSSRLTLMDTELLSNVGDDGSFEGRIVGHPGDLIRLRVRGHGSRIGPWRALRLPGGGSRRPDVALFRIGFRAVGQHRRYQLVNIGRPRPISEPGVLLDLRNERTGMVQRIAISKNGGFARATYVTAQPLDRIAVTLADRPEHPLGVLVVPERGGTTPARKRLSRAVSGHAATVFDVGPLAGSLFHGQPKASDVVQGEVPNCHLAGAATAVAATCGDRLAKLFRQIDRQHYAVSLYCYDQSLRRFVRKRIIVANEFYMRPSGSLLFGSPAPLTAGRTRASLWWPLLEKAVARLKNGYGHFVAGGTPYHALSMLLGQPPHHREVPACDPDRLWQETVLHLRGRRPVVLSTFSARSARLYRYTRIMPDHCYAVLGLSETRRGERTIRVRNPWGEVTPTGYVDHGQGVFTMPWDDAMRWFANWSSVSDRR